MRTATLDEEALDCAWPQHEDLSRDGQLILEVGHGLSDGERDDKPISVSSPDGGAQE